MQCPCYDSRETLHRVHHFDHEKHLRYRSNKIRHESDVMATNLSNGARFCRTHLRQEPGQEREHHNDHQFSERIATERHEAYCTKTTSTNLYTTNHILPSTCALLQPITPLLNLLQSYANNRSWRSDRSQPVLKRLWQEAMKDCRTYTIPCLLTLQKWKYKSRRHPCTPLRSF